MPSLKSVFYSVVLCAHATYLSAETVSLSDLPDMTLTEAIERTLRKSPDLRASQDAIEVLRAKGEQAGLGTNPTFRASAEDFFGSGDASGVDGMQATLSLSFVLDQSLVSSKSQQATATTSLAEASIRLGQIDQAAETARRYVMVLGVEAQLAEYRAALNLTEQSERTINQAVTAGRRHAADLYRARTSLAQAKLSVEDAEHELRVARHHLAARWGSLAPDFRGVRGDLQVLPTAKSWREILVAFEASPLKEKFLSQARLAQSNLSLEQSKARQPLQYEVGLRHIGVSDDVALVAGVSVPLSWKNKNQGNIQAAEKEIAVLQAIQAAEVVELKTRLYELYESFEHSLHQANILRHEILPNLQDALNQTEVAFQQGRYTYQELQSVQRELLDMKQTLIQTNVQAHLHLIEIERLTGITVNKEHTL